MLARVGCSGPPPRFGMGPLNCQIRHATGLVSRICAPKRGITGPTRPARAKAATQAAVPGLQAHRWFVEEVEHPKLSMCIAHDDNGRLVCASFGKIRGRGQVLRTANKLGISDLRAHTSSPSRAATQIRAYLDGELREFDLPLAPHGTAFELQAWAALCEIPWGTTRSYKQQAAAIGRGPGSARAVGRANGANPIAIVIPCHRVLGADGSLTGFGGGLDTKAMLLALESKQRSLFAAELGAAAPAKEVQV